MKTCLKKMSNRRGRGLQLCFLAGLLAIASLTVERLRAEPAAESLTGNTASNPIPEPVPLPEPAQARAIPHFTALSVDDTHYETAAHKPTVTVVAFLGVECPIANLYIPRLEELATEFKDDPVLFLAVNSNEQDSLTQVREQARKHKVSIPFLKDAGNKVADLFDAQRTPEVFVLDAERRVRYRGAIDDQYGYAYRRQSAGKQYLKDAVQAVLANRQVAVAQTEVEGCHIGRKRTPRKNASVTFYHDVLPILQNRCQQCHREGEVAPFALQDYDEVSSWAETIKEVVQTRRMPPWPADSPHGKFRNDPRLSKAELATLVKWVDSGAPAGDAASGPPQKEWHTGWNIGEPDVVYEMRKPFKVPATGTVPYQYFVVTEPFPEDRWVQAVECRPGNRAVVHHILALLTSGKKEDQKEERQEHGFLAAFAPGNGYGVYPEGQAKRIPAGKRIVFQMHYTANGTAQEDVSRIGLVYAKAPPKHEVRTRGFANTKILIRAGEDNHVETHSARIREDMEINVLMPHLHMRGKSFEFKAKYPDGREEILLSVPRWDFNWQLPYFLDEPLRLPKGTEMTITAHWDNSENNPNNIFPLVDVKWGEQTWDEMFIGYVNYLKPVDEVVKKMSRLNSVAIVEEFWDAVWKARDPEAIDRFVVDDFVITTGGVDVASKARFKEWVRAFLEKIPDLEFESIETFQNEEGSRVASRWRVTGRNNGILGTAADQREITFTGTAIWAVREDGKLLHNWVERSAWELFQQLQTAE